MKPDDLLNELASAYAGCESYRDRGQVISRFIHRGHRLPRTQIRPFETAFIRPDRFRFEFRSRRGEGDDEWDRYIVWALDDDVRTWWDVRPGVERGMTLGRALAGATGVSGGSAHTLPALLMPDRVGGRRLTDLAGLTLMEDDVIDERACHRIRGTWPPPTAEEGCLRVESIRPTGRPPERAEHGPWTLWIDAETRALRRMESTTFFESFRVEAVTTYEPTLDGPIPDPEQAFRPPDLEDP